MTTALAERLWCPDCRGVRDVEPVHCVDGHAECPDRACVECGAALLLPVALLDVEPLPIPAVA